jgi:hypothetical protein
MWVCNTTPCLCFPPPTSMNCRRLHKVITFPFHFSPAPLGVGVGQHHSHFVVVLCVSFLPITIHDPEKSSPSTLTTNKTGMCPFPQITSMLTHPWHRIPTPLLLLISYQCRLELINNHAALYQPLPPPPLMPLPVVAHTGPQKSGGAHLLPRLLLPT